MIKLITGLTQTQTDMSKRIEVKQHDITDCGAACLVSIASFYKLEISISRVRQIASTDKKGTNILGLIEAASKLGFTAKGVKSLKDDGSKNTEPLYKIPDRKSVV